MKNYSIAFGCLMSGIALDTFIHNDSVTHFDSVTV